jgi:hypothetical protein
MHAIPKAVVLLSVSLALMIWAGTDRVQSPDKAAAVTGVSPQTVPHRVDMHMLANAFN